MGWIEKYSTFDHVLVVGMYWHLYSGLGLQIMLRCIALGRQRCVQTLTCGAHGVYSTLVLTYKGQSFYQGNCIWF
jgi:hypothetical protein